MTPSEIQNKVFEKKMGGYKIEAVASYLQEVASYVQDLLDEKEDIESKMLVLADKLEEYREDEESLRAALIGAQKLGDSVVRDAKKKAEMMLKEASAKADELVNDAKSSIDREAIALTRMQGQVSKFKVQILEIYKKHIEMINAIPDDSALVQDVKKMMNGMDTNEPSRSSSSKAGFSDDQNESSENGAHPDHAALELLMQRSKRGGFGDLRFGEEYSLTRTD